MILTTTIGSYPKPEFLKLPDWFQSDKGTDTERPTANWKGAMSALGEKKEELIEKAVQEVINDQINCGIDIVTDGEVRRENYIHHHCRYINGIDFDYLTKKTARTGNYDCYLPTIVSKVKFTEPFLNKEFQINQKNSTKPVKITLPGPLTITDTIADNFYFNDKDLGIDLSILINEEVKALADAGCRYIQIDEPLFARKPTDANNFGIENLERCFHGVSNNVEKIVHICCGYPDKIDSNNYPKAPLHSYNDIAINLEDSTIDTISIEDAHRHNDLKLLELFKTKKIIFGLIKIASSEIENIDEIKSRVLDCLNHIDKERLIAAPDCGMGYLSREMAIQKLENLNKAVKDI
jgi:5-methyltetrahydropteroyltriglutamate--homocysteine methyltransferase